ncbi:uncharacterized protein LOC141533706 [Cotesia typhae]|uniref:uncharacterized protein LOC141533706 n=1 Tax=Cotesia typhae TaxID=2053667 RepID=UPI003D6934DC
MKIKIRAIFGKFRKSLSNGLKLAGEEIVSTFKAARSKFVKELDVPDLINIKRLDDFPVPNIKKVEGEVHIGETKISDLEFYFESGRVRKVFNELRLDGIISEKIEKGIQKQIEHCPAKRIADLEEEIVKLKKGKMKDYDIPIDEAKEKLSTAQKNKLIDRYNAGLKAAAATGGVVLAAGVAALGIDQLIQECHKAKGCFLFKNETGEAGRCKLKNRSCAYGDHPHRIPHCDSTSMDKLIPNFNLVIRYLKTYKPTELLNDFKSRLIDDERDGEEKNIIEEKIKKIENNTITNKEIKELIERPGLEEKMNKFCEANRKSLTFTNFCDLLDDQERTETACVACNPSAPHNSLQYVNIEELSETVRPRCDENPTLWEAFAKIAGDTPRDIADALGLTEAWKSIIMWIGVFIGVMVIFIGAGYLVYMFRKKGEDDEISYSELENEDDDDEHHNDEHHKDEKKTEES